MLHNAPTPDELRRSARLKREAARLALLEDQGVVAAVLHAEAIALEDAAKEMDRDHAKR